MIPMSTEPYDGFASRPRASGDDPADSALKRENTA